MQLPVLDTSRTIDLNSTIIESQTKNSDNREIYAWW